VVINAYFVLRCLHLFLFSVKSRRPVFELIRKILGAALFVDSFSLKELQNILQLHQKPSAAPIQLPVHQADPDEPSHKKKLKQKQRKGRKRCKKLIQRPEKIVTQSIRLSENLKNENYGSIFSREESKYDDKLLDINMSYANNKETFTFMNSFEIAAFRHNKLKLMNSNKDERSIYSILNAMNDFNLLEKSGDKSKMSSEAKSIRPMAEGFKHTRFSKHLEP